MTDQPQIARASLTGRRVAAEAEIRLTTGGVLAITALVCGILLSTTVLVSTAIRRGAEAERN